MKYDGRLHCLTRLGFRLNCTLRILTRIPKIVLGKRKDVEAGMSSYIDDILMDETVMIEAEIVEHLTKFGLATKSPEPLERGEERRRLEIEKG